jgi:hypothetical protein
LVLYHARFGFASAFRQLVAVGQGRAIRAHMIMLGSGSVLFAFLIVNGTGFNGVKLTPTLAPLSLSLVVGAFLFGVGMQLAGACASGTLFSIGGGSTPLVVTLFGFIGGSVLGAWGAGLLGLIFALSFCPISAALFFGGLIPLSVREGSSFLLPALYGIGTALPVVLFAVLIAFGAGYVSRAFDRVRQLESVARRLTGALFIVVGIYFCLTYIFGIL